MVKEETFVNYKGEPVSPIPVLRRPEYGEIDEDGVPVVRWKQFTINADDDGFDLSNRETNGKHRETIILAKNTRLIRYGPRKGSYTAPIGTDYEELSMPYIKESLPYHEYVVIADAIKVSIVRRRPILGRDVVTSKRIPGMKIESGDKGCKVERGKAAPGFDQPGGGIQYLHEKNINESLNDGLLEEII